jgi:HEAT repeat protein
LQAIGKLGDSSSVEFLAQFASEAFAKEEKAAAIKSLMLLSGDGVDKTITEIMQQSEPAIRPQLIEVLSERNAISAVPVLLSESENPDSRIRRAAFKALGRLAEQKDLQALVRILVNSSTGSSRDAERAIVMVSNKNPDENTRADIVLAALSNEKHVPAKCALMRVLGGIANSKALDTLSKTSKQTDPTLRDAAVRSLVQWPNGSAAKILLDIYIDDSQSGIHRLLALRGFARVLALPADGRSQIESLELCRLAMSKSSNTDQKKLVLSGLGNVAHPDALEMAVSYLQLEDIRAEAATATIKIAGSIGRTHPDKARESIKKVLAATQTQFLHEQALDILQQIESANKKPASGR